MAGEVAGVVVEDLLGVAEVEHRHSLTAACGTSTPQSTPATNVTANDPVVKAPASNLDAAAVFKSLAAAVPTTKLTETLTAANDPNLRVPINHPPR
ncbi:hypothetical protein ACWGCW_19165 [Streptomyces sp. NPDC054933]